MRGFTNTKDTTDDIGANAALSNLASVAINTSLISDTDSTDDLGSTSKQWANLYVDNVKCATVTDLTIENDGLDKDIIFKINDGTVDTEMFRLDGDVSTIVVNSKPINGITTLGMAGDLTNYEAVNDANPQIRIGSADADEGHIQAVFDSGAQTLDYLLISTDSAGEGDISLNPAGFVGVTTTSPDRLFHVEAADSGTNTVTFAQRLGHITDGTAVASFGTGIEFELEENDGTARVAATMEVIWTDAGESTSADGAIVFKTMIADAAATEAFRIAETGCTVDQNLTIGDGTAATDFTLTFNGETNDGVITWMEDEDYFQYSDDILISGAENLYFRDTAILINSSTDGQMDIDADTEVEITTPTCQIVSSTKVDLDTNALDIGTGADTDIVVNFVANTNSGVLTWMEDEDYFKFGDDIYMDDGRTIELFNALGTDHTATGIITTDTVGDNVNIGDLLYMNADGTYKFVDADAAATMPGVVMALATISSASAGKLLHQGYVRDDTWNWTIGGLIYATVTATTGNTLSQTAPSGSGDQVQVVGYAVTADIMWFAPSLVLVEVA